jgi:V/A-type H+-transporting ATPase subunit E
MTGEVKVENLESALLERAKSLADEYLARAKRSRSRILEEENERLRLREERETLAAKAMAERTYRRRVQASELHLQEDLDRLRWQLVQAVLDDLNDRLARVAADEQRYPSLLEALLASAAQSIADPELVAEVNAHDLERLGEGWEQLARRAVPDKRIVLAEEPIRCTGGVRVRDEGNHMRVDNTFEGRLERLVELVHQAIVDRLFAQATHMGALFHG